MTSETPATDRVGRAAWLTAAAVFLLLLCEWLFLVTKPSPLSLFGWRQRVAVLLAAGFVTALPAAGLAAAIGLAWRRLTGRWRRHAAAAALAVPAMVLAATALLLLENFTKTVFGFNLGSFTSPLRYLYAAGTLLLAVRMHRSLARRGAGAANRRRRPLAVATILLLAASAVAAWVRYEPRRTLESLVRSGGGELPNVLILSTDGLNADHMSVYGYERPTTPFLEARAAEFLISENHFSNSVVTGPSIAALLSGKLPMRTGVLRTGNALSGAHVFEHLPGLLRQLGYYNIDISARFYGDAWDMNMRQGFHIANGRILRSETLPILGWLGGAYPAELHFVGLTVERLRERLLHAVGLADMRDFYDVVAKKYTPWIRDEDRLDLLEAAIARAPGPYFAHVHLLDTHRLPPTGPGPPPQGFPVRLSRYSARPDAGWSDFYDDTILGYDDFVARIVARLEAAGELDRTVLVLNSDHGERRRARVRLPLMIRFPGAEPRGRIAANTQRIDLAPTLLSHLGLRPPDWMTGRSLIDGPLDPLQPLVVAGEGRRRSVSWLALVQCQRAYVYNVATAILSEETVAGHTAPCAEEELLGAAEARRRLFDRLEGAGTFDLPLAMQLASLQRDNDPEMRRKAVTTIRQRQVPALWLGEEIAVTRAHADLWTEGVHPAALLLRNEGERPVRHELVVRSGERREFPVRFFVQDEAATREHLFTAPGSLVVDLGEVAPAEERLLLVWSDRSWTAGAGRPARGVQLLPTGSWLRNLLRRERPEEWRRAARLILERRVPSVRLADGWVAANVHGDLWSRGDEPAGVAVRNDAAEPLVPRLVVRGGMGRQLPLRFHLHASGQSHAYLMERPGGMTIELPEVPPGAERLFVIRSENAWVPDVAGGRELGVRLSAAPTPAGSPE